MRALQGGFARTLACALAVLLGIALWGFAAANVPDKGTFKIYQGGNALGTESFDYVISADSMLIAAHARLLLPSVPDDTLFKDMALVVKTEDYDLRAYRSQQTFRGAAIVRGLVLGDTAFTVYGQSDAGGTATRLVRPPGRMFVVDPFLYSMFDVIARNVYDKKFETRSLKLLVLAAKDSIMDASATDHGSERIPWGGKPVQCRKIAVSDGTTEFMLWISPIGRMLRLEQLQSGLRVERVPPPVKPRKRPDG